MKLRQGGDDAGDGTGLVGAEAQSGDEQRRQPRHGGGQAESDHGESPADHHARALLSNR